MKMKRFTATAFFAGLLASQGQATRGAGATTGAPPPTTPNPGAGAPAGTDITPGIPPQQAVDPDTVPATPGAPGTGGRPAHGVGPGVTTGAPPWDWMTGSPDDDIYTLAEPDDDEAAADEWRPDIDRPAQDAGMRQMDPEARAAGDDDGAPVEREWAPPAAGPDPVPGAATDRGFGMEPYEWVPQARGPLEQPIERPGRRTVDPYTGATLDSHWDGTNERPIGLGDIGDQARSTLEMATLPGDFGSQVTRITYDGREAYRALVTGPHGNRFLFVDTDGGLIKTQQQVPFSEAPLMVQGATRQLTMGALGFALKREVKGASVSYILRITRLGEPTRLIQLDEAGNVINTHEEIPRY
jgi:hypothetical protein